MQMRDHRFRLPRRMRFEPCSDILQEAEDLFLLRDGETASPKALDMEPEDIHAVFHRNNFGLFLIEVETSHAEPFCTNRLDRLHVFPRFSRHPQGIGIASKARLSRLYALGPC